MARSASPGAPSPEPPFRLLAISDGSAGPTVRFVAWLARLADAGVDGIQIREKSLPDRQLFELCRLARKKMPATTKVVVNGRADLALAAGCAGIHLPADSPPIRQLRQRFGKKLLIGKSTHSLDEVAAAQRDGADYVTFGPIFVTPSKVRFGPPQGLKKLRAAADLGIPVIALGGVDQENTQDTAEHGASGVSGIRIFRTNANAMAVLARRIWPCSMASRGLS